MELKLDIPTQDYKKLITDLYEHISNSYHEVEVRNRIEEKGFYCFTVIVKPGFNLDTGEFDDKGKVELTISCLQPKMICPT